MQICFCVFPLGLHYVLFRPTLFEIQTFSLYPEGHPRKMAAFYQIFTQSDTGGFQSSLCIPLFQFPLLLLSRLDSFFFLLSLSVGGHWIFNYHGKMTESWWGRSGGTESFWQRETAEALCRQEICSCMQTYIMDTLHSYKNASERCISKIISAQKWVSDTAQ